MVDRRRTIISGGTRNRHVKRHPIPFVNESQHVLNRLSHRFRRGPAGELFGHVIHERDMARVTRRNDGFANTRECHLQPLALLPKFPIGVKFVERQFDLSGQLSVIKGPRVPFSSQSATIIRPATPLVRKTEDPNEPLPLPREP